MTAAGTGNKGVSSRTAGRQGRRDRLAGKLLTHFGEGMPGVLMSFERFRENKLDNGGNITL